MGVASVIGFFLYPQLGFHRKLRAEKLKAIKDISDLRTFTFSRQVEK